MHYCQRRRSCYRMRCLTSTPGWRDSVRSDTLRVLYTYACTCMCSQRFVFSVVLCINSPLPLPLHPLPPFLPSPFLPPTLPLSVPPLSLPLPLPPTPFSSSGDVQAENSALKVRVESQETELREEGLRMQTLLQQNAQLELDRDRK